MYIHATSAMSLNSLPGLYIQVMQRFSVVYHWIRHESIVFPKRFACIPKTRGFLWHTTRECCMTISYPRYKVANVGRNNNTTFIECNIVKYTKTFLYSDWLYFLCYCIKGLMLPDGTNNEFQTDTIFASYRERNHRRVRNLMKEAGVRV